MYFCEEEADEVEDSFGDLAARGCEGSESSMPDASMSAFCSASGSRSFVSSSSASKRFLRLAPVDVGRLEVGNTGLLVVDEGVLLFAKENPVGFFVLLALSVLAALLRPKLRPGIVQDVSRGCPGSIEIAILRRSTVICLETGLSLRQRGISSEGSVLLDIAGCLQAAESL